MQKNIKNIYIYIADASADASLPRFLENDASTSPLQKNVPVSSPLCATLVCPQDLDLLPCLVLHKSLKLLEPLEDLILGLQKENPGLLGVVIN